MGMIFRKQTTRPLPATAEIIFKAGKRVARWRSRGKLFTESVTGPESAPRLTTTSKFYSARFRDYSGRVVERSTECRDRQAAEQMLGKWEREQEQIRAGVLDATALETVRASVGSLAEHLDAYWQSLTAKEVTATYRANALRAIRRLIDDLDLTKLSDLRRDKIEPWLSEAIAAGMSARTRNYYRDAGARFLNWCLDTGRVLGHDLNKLPKADERSDPRRKRRALTEVELNRVLAVAQVRPLADARMIRTGARKGEAGAQLRPEAVAALEDTGRERVLIYRTLVLTGLRLNELKTLTVAQVDLTRGAESIRLEAKNEKNRSGSEIPLRSDLADELRSWIHSKKLNPSSLLFTVAAGLRRILDRDLDAAGIPKRDERGRTVDVHALRTTFATMLTTSGIAPRTAQAAMRHANLQLTMGTYTDAKHLGVREAMERLPKLNSATPDDSQVAPHVALLPCNLGQNGSFTDNRESLTHNGKRVGVSPATPGNVHEKAPVTSWDIAGASIGVAGIEPTTSCSQGKRSTKLSYTPSFTIIPRGRDNA